MSSIMRNLGIATRGPDAQVLLEPMFVLARVMAFVRTKHIPATIEVPTFRDPSREKPISATFFDEPVSLQRYRLDEVANFLDQKSHYHTALDVLRANGRLCIQRLKCAGKRITGRGASRLSCMRENDFHAYPA